MLKSIQGKNGTFDFKVDEDYISVLGNGYIITKEGYFIYVKEHHADTFTDFLNAYYGCGVGYTNKRWESTDGAVQLAREGFIAYFGIKVGDRPTNQGNGILILPDKDITPEQEDSLLILLKTNRSVFNPENLKMALTITTVDNFVHKKDESIDEIALVNRLEEKQQERAKSHVA